MDIEIEAKFANVNKDEVRAKLKSIGATLIHPEILMRRKVYEHPTNKQNDWFRVRDEGKKITMSYKKLNDRTLHGTQEISFVVPDFDQACRFLENASLKFTSYQETRREMWKLGSAEITIDTWPWVPTFVEVEAQTEDEVKKVSALLGFDWSKSLHGSVENIYMEHFNVSEREVDDWSEIVFSSVPEWLEEKRK